MIGPAAARPDDVVVDLAVQENERYVDRRQLAELMGVSVSTVDRLVGAGMPSVVWGQRARRFRPSVALAWARAHGADGRRSAA